MADNKESLFPKKISITHKSIRPRGFFLAFLRKQMEGLTGHIRYAGYPFDRVEWGQPQYLSDNGNEQWWVYEQTAYWLDGYTRCATLLEDQVAISEAARIIYNVIHNPDKDGYLGPAFLKETDGWNRWPHVVFFRACLALYEYNDDLAIPQALARHYLRKPCRYDGFRDILNCEIMLRLYGILGDLALLHLAEENYRKYNENCNTDLCERAVLSRKKPYAHGVSYNEFAKLGSLFYQYTGERAYLKVSVAAYRKIDRWFMLPGGCNCSDEFLISNHFMHSIETCDVSDYTWSLHDLLIATGDASYADRIEKCIFNAGIGAVTEDFKALQYFSCANQMILTEHSNHNAFFRGNGWMQYSPNPGTECCPGNVNRFMPNYICNSWHAQDHTVSCLTFCSSEFTYTIGKDSIHIIEDTAYPFGETFAFDIHTTGSFQFRFRVPGWASMYRVLVGAKEITAEAGTFVEYPVCGDVRIVVLCQSEICEKKSGEGVYYEKGVLVYSYGMKGNRERGEGKNGFTPYRMTPDREWRYRLFGNPKFHPCDTASDMDLNLPLPYMEIRARVLPDVGFAQPKRVVSTTDLYHKKHKVNKGNFIFTPDFTKEKPTHFGQETTVRLYPYAACKLRLTVFGKDE